MSVATQQQAAPVVVYTAEDPKGSIRMSTMWASMASLVAFAMVYKKKVLEPRELEQRKLAGLDEEEDLSNHQRRTLTQGFAAAGINYMYVPILMASSLLLVTNFFYSRSRVSELTRLGDQIAVRTFDMRGQRAQAKMFQLQEMRIEEENQTELVVVPMQHTAKAMPYKFRFDLPCDEVKKLFQGQYGVQLPGNRTVKLAPSVGGTSQEDTLQFERSLLGNRRKAKRS